MPEAGAFDQVAELHALERQAALFDFRIDGWSAWRVLRNPIHRCTQALPLAQPARSQAARVRAALRNTLRLAVLLLRGRAVDVWVKTCRSGLRLSEGTRFRDVYFDGLLAGGRRYLKIEEVNSPDFDRQAAASLFPAHLDPVLFTFWGMVLARLRPVKEARAFCVQLAAMLHSRLGLQISDRWLLARISTAYWQSRLYVLLLRRLRPKAVLVSDTGEYGLIVACKRLGIPLIELQHGVFDAQHPDAIPDWVEGDAAELLLPDHLACRGTYWMAQLRGTRQGRDHAVAVGNELIDLARAQRQQREVKPTWHLVLSSQGLDTQRLVVWIEAMVAAAPPTLDWQLTIKLHPVYDAGTCEFEPLARHPRVRIVGGAEQPNVFTLLAQGDLHLSIASACHFDAAALGLPSLVIPLAGHEAMLDALEGDLLQLVGAPGDVWASCHRPAHVDPDRTHAFAAPGFVNNLERLLA